MALEYFKKIFGYKLTHEHSADPYWKWLPRRCFDRVNNSFHNVNVNVQIMNEINLFWWNLF